MRPVMAFIVSSALGFGVTQALTPQPSAPAAWAPPPLRPPPLDLPASSCSEVPATAEASWSAEAAERFLVEQVDAFDGVDLVEVDCQEAPCVAWLRWEDGRRHPRLTYRWWSLEDEVGATLWTASHSFRAPSGLLQAVVIAPARPSAAQRARTQQRVADGRQRLEAPSGR